MNDAWICDSMDRCAGGACLCVHDCVQCRVWVWVCEGTHSYFVSIRVCMHVRVCLWVCMRVHKEKFSKLPFRKQDPKGLQGQLPVGTRLVHPHNQPWGTGTLWLYNVRFHFEHVPLTCTCSPPFVIVSSVFLRRQWEPHWVFFWPPYGMRVLCGCECDIIYINIHCYFVLIQVYIHFLFVSWVLSQRYWYLLHT